MKKIELKSTSLRKKRIMMTAMTSIGRNTLTMMRRIRVAIKLIMSMKSILGIILLRDRLNKMDRLIRRQQQNGREGINKSISIVIKVDMAAPVMQKAITPITSLC